MMHLRSILVVAISFALTMVWACDQDHRNRDSVTIDDVRNVENPPDYGSPAENAVFVQRTIFLGNGYYVLFYPRQEGELKEYGAFYASDEDYDVAYYKWLSDSEVEVELANTDSGESVEFVVYGTGGTTGLRFEEE